MVKSIYENFVTMKKIWGGFLNTNKPLSTGVDTASAKTSSSFNSSSSLDRLDETDDNNNNVDSSTPSDMNNELQDIKQDKHKENNIPA